MVARIPLGLSTSALVHAAGVSLLVLIPVLGRAPLPEPSTERTLVFPPDLLPPRTPAATAVPPRARRAVARPARARSMTPQILQAVIAVPTPDSEPAEIPIDVPICLECPVGGKEIGPGTDGPIGDGSPDAEVSGGDGGATPLRVGTGVDAPRKIRHVAPSYPELARRGHLQGTVELECVIDPAGAVSEIRVVRGHALLSKAAVEAVQQWLYRPTRLNGVPVPIVMTVTVHFGLRRES